MKERLLDIFGEKSEGRYFRKLNGNRKEASGKNVLDCEVCGLYKQCKSPRMGLFGEGRKGILIVGEAPGAEEDEKGIPFVGRSGQLLSSVLRREGIFMDKDCWRTNVVQCRPPNNRTPTKEEIRCCKSRFEEAISSVSPKVILCLGAVAIQGVLDDMPFSASVSKLSGLAIPSFRRNCWVVCSYHPAYFVRNGGKDLCLLFDAVKKVKECLNVSIVQRRVEEDDFVLLEDFDEVVSFLERISTIDKPVAMDYETNCLSPFEAGSKLLTVSLVYDSGGACIPLEHREARWDEQQLKQIYSLLAKFLTSDVPKIIHNWNFEEVWSRAKLGVSINNVVRDTEVFQHILDGRRGASSLGFQTYVRWGTTYKTEVNRTNLDKESLDRVARYNYLDSKYTLLLKQEQDKESTESFEKAYALFHRALPIMADFTYCGVKVDKEWLEEFSKQIEGELVDIEKNRESLPILKEFEKQTGHRWNSASYKDRKILFYDMLGLRPVKTTVAGNDAVDKDSLEAMRMQVAGRAELEKFFDGLILESKLRKLYSTYIVGIKEVIGADGHLHPSFHLHTTESYRSSSSDPNLQNIPARDGILSRVRRAMVATNDLIMEADFSGLEVRIAASLSNDRNLIEDICSGQDTHRYWASRLYQKPPEEITGEERTLVKGAFVFALIYGSYWKTIAHNLELPEEHVRRLEEEFWQRHYGLARWRQNMVDFYRINGYIETVFGFRRYAPLNEKQIYNTPIQSSAFHVVLSVIIEVYRRMREEGLRSYMFGQIHDSLLFDVFADEAVDIVRITEESIDKVCKSLDWLKTPLKVKWKASKSMLLEEEI